MKRIIVFFGVVVLLASLYIASPFVAAWRIREAVKAGDTVYIADKVDWAQVRDSLKSSIKRHAILAEEVDRHGGAVPPSMWQRVKLAFGQPMVDSFVERYVTPEGLPELYRMKTTYASTVRGQPVDSQSSRSERMAAFAKRITRAEFQSLGQVEIEVVDRIVAERRYVGRLELVGFDWTLTRLEVKTMPIDGAPGAPPQATPQRLIESRIGAGPRLP